MALCWGSKSGSYSVKIWSICRLFKGSFQGMQRYRQCREEHLLHRNTPIILKKTPTFIPGTWNLRSHILLLQNSHKPSSQQWKLLLAWEQRCVCWVKDMAQREDALLPELIQPRSWAAWGPEKMPLAYRVFKAGAVGIPEVWVHISHGHRLQMTSVRPKRTCAFQVHSISQLHYTMFLSQSLWRHGCPSCTLTGR